MKIRYVFASICMFSFVVLIAWAYNKVVVQGDASMTVPLIKAEKAPYKIPPEHPGGLDIPHQDSGIYNALSGEPQGQEPVYFQNDVLEDDETSSALKKGFVLEQTDKDMQGNKPRIESLFNTDETDQTRDQAIEKAKRNIEQQVGQPEKVADQSDGNTYVSDTDIVDMHNALKGKITQNDIAPEEVDAGIIIVDPKTVVDTIKSPIPLAKPVKSMTADKLTEGVRPVVTPQTKDDASAPAVDKKFSDILDSLNAAPVDEFKEVHAYVMRTKPAGRSSASTKPYTAYSISPTGESASSGTAVSSQAAPQNASNHYIQLASLPSERDAARAWSQLQARYPDVLGDLPVSYMKADLGTRGIYTRIQAGPMSEPAARQACADLVTAGNRSGCLVVTR